MKVFHLGECCPYELVPLFQILNMDTAVVEAAT
jgi:hypothetical protein